MVLTLILSFLMAFSIGSNDAANGLATSYGSKATELIYLLILGAIAEFIGAMFCADQVAATLSKDIIPKVNSLTIDEQKRVMFSVCLASFLFIITSSLSGMPISGTHTVVGALLGAGIVATGFGSLNWNKLGTIVFSWFLSPAMAAIIAFFIMQIISYLTLNTKRFTYGTRIHAL